VDSAPDSGPESERSGPSDSTDYVQVQESPEFSELRSTYRSFAFPLTVGFIAWYLLYVLLSNYAADFMATKVVGSINVAFVLGLLQFLTTFLIAVWYSRFAASKFDPKAAAIKNRLEGDA